MEKITKRQVYEALLAYAHGSEDMIYEVENETRLLTLDCLAEFAANEISLLDAKAAKAKEKAAAKKAEGNELTEVLRQIMSKDEFEPIFTITERINDEDVTIGKVTYRLNELVSAGEAEKQLITLPVEEGQKARKVQGYKLIG